MNCFSEAAITDARKSVNPSWVKGHRVILPSIEKKKEAPLSQKDIAALTIQRAWLSHMDKRIFYLLKHTVFAAGYHVAHEILKNVSPVEAELVKDPSVEYKIRFRLYNGAFPGTENLLGQLLEAPAVPRLEQMRSLDAVTGKLCASTDACKVMGKKKFHEQIMEDEHLSPGVQNK